MATGAKVSVAAAATLANNVGVSFEYLMPTGYPHRPAE